ncbi:MAG TPA: 4Fe-4S dicluster domain-containing protein [Polyangia bacterium]|nr:4Fe-4S dicluster domain-containing protein [Polyangia bacterium]
MSSRQPDGNGNHGGSCTGEKAQRVADAALLQIRRRAPSIAAEDDADDGGQGGGSRRDFLSLMGFSLGAVGLAGGCRAPVQNAIPLPVATPEMVPGVALTFATTCGACPSSCALLVKQRDGRPIKIDGNPDSSLFGGGTCATGQASLLSLYDGDRLRGPLWHGQPLGWAEIDQKIGAALSALTAAGGERSGRHIVLLSGTITSPSTRAVIAAWGRRFPHFRHVVADAVSASALREASRRTFGRAVVPHFAFDKARVIIGLDADFLGTWLSPVEFAHAYAAGRRTAARSSWLHVQIESGFSVTGSNADLRLAVAPSELGAVAAALYARVARRARAVQSAQIQRGADADADAGTNDTALASSASPAASEARLDLIAEQLWQARGASLVVSGSNDLDLQMLVAALNVLLDNVGRTVDVARGSLQRQGSDRALVELTAQMAAGQVDALVIHGANPAYDHPDGASFIAALNQVPLSISLSSHRDETSAVVHAVCPDHHFLESWGDAEPVEGTLSLSQPLIAPLFSTRAAPESLLRWAGQGTRHYDHVRDHWRREVFPRQTAEANFEAFWDRTLQRGVLRLADAGAPVAAPMPAREWTAAAAVIAEKFRDAIAQRRADRFELHTFESVALRDGRHAANPWLQELPDPITRIAWGNVAAVSPELSRQLAVVTGDVVGLTVGEHRIELPVFVQAGQAPRTVSVALGHGRRAAGRAGSGVGANAFALGSLSVAGRTYTSTDLAIEKTGHRVLLPSAQTHLSMEDRPIVLTTTTLDGEHAQPAEPAEPAEALPTLWKAPPTGAHAWGMAIDLDACTGCSACVVACQVENNVPVVGKDQVQRNRIMHWLRIDRYFDGPDDDPHSLHQPMMCQHCGNAPCETVCPVLATTTGSEGLNQQVYNRCIGTRYCANNCPYKVRRFNWLEYTKAAPHASHMEDPLGRLVLNPDVTVRTRGVMEKCSLCVQRIQLGKNQALQQRREIGDGDVQTACQQSCPTGAITFGDLMDPDSRVSRLLKSPRAYQVLAELGTRPNVGYLKRVRRPLPAAGEKP